MSMVKRMRMKENESFFKGPDLRNADLRNAKLYRADLRASNLLNAPVLPALHGANLVLAKLEGIYFNGCLKSVASIKLRFV